MANEAERPEGNSVGWKCGTCGELITRTEDGWVEWLASEDEQGATRLKGLRLVHRISASPRRQEAHGCQYDDQMEFRKDQSIVEGLPLERFVGPDGLMLLLSLIAADDMARDEVVELTKRVQVPGYEQARELLAEAIKRGVVVPMIGTGYYLQSEIKAILQWALHEVQIA